jgi:hypothetical protein
MNGALAISLTNYGSYSRPDIAQWSIAEVAGNLFRFSTENVISTTGVTSTSACDYYIKLVPSSSECSAQFSTVVPTWRTDYQGYYENSTSANRVIGEVYFSGADYINKTIYYARGIMKQKYCNGLATSTVALMYNPSTITVPMDGPIANVTSIKLMGVYVYSFYITSYTIQSTQVVLVLATNAATSTETYYGSIFVSGNS